MPACLHGGMHAWQRAERFRLVAGGQPVHVPRAAGAGPRPGPLLTAASASASAGGSFPSAFASAKAVPVRAGKPCPAACTLSLLWRFAVPAGVCIKMWALPPCL